jgi:hypothetical protein
MYNPTPKSAFGRRLLLCAALLPVLLIGCRDPDEERSLRALAYADVLDEVTLVLRVERLAYPVLLEELSAAQSRLRRGVSDWPVERLLEARRLYPGTPEAERALAAERRRLSELEAALLLETGDLLAEPDPPRPRDGEFDADLRLVAAFTPEERFDSLVHNGLDERAEALLAEYDLERRTEGLDWHEFVGRLASSLSEYTPVAAAHRRANRVIQRRLEDIARYLDGLDERENPFAEDYE